MKFSILHPEHENIRAEYGWDHAIGFFVQVFEDAYPTAEYDALQPRYNRARPLNGALAFLVSQTFFSGDELEEALARMSVEEWSEIPEPARRVAQVVLNFRAAAD